MTIKACLFRTWLFRAWLGSVMLVLGAAGLGASGVTGCSAPTTNMELFGKAKDMPGCNLAVRKCSRCHEPERIFSYKAPEPRFWRSVVNRMRRKGGSNINREVGQKITDCLVVRSFGTEGLETLKRGTGDDQP